MQYKGLEIIVFEQTPGKWRTRIRANGSPLKDKYRLLESVTFDRAIEALAFAMEAVDATGPFSRKADWRQERFWRLLFRKSENSGRSAPRLTKKKARRRRTPGLEVTDIPGDD